jgi:hypothetical protein
MGTDLLTTVYLSGSIVAWLRDAEIDLEQEGQRAGEREWRAELVSVEPFNVGRGRTWRLDISVPAARELMCELRERADFEASLPVRDRAIEPYIVYALTEKIRKEIEPLTMRSS